jgi:hypothetical protein
MTAKRVVPRSSKKRKVNLLSDVPAIGKYLDRIGAEAKSPRTARVTSDDPKSHYERNDLARISFARDGTWHVKPADLAPTEEERAEIEKQVADYEFPTLKRMAKPKPPKEVEQARKANPDSVFEFRDLSGDLVMYQVRVDLKDDKKIYVPWTYWDDDQWRNCEPDEPLPLWGLEQLKNHSTVFLHEGAKSARAGMRIAEADERNSTTWPPTYTDEQQAAQEAKREAALRHPWRAELSRAAHLGWIGGANNPGRTDWSPLGKPGLKPYRVFIVVDNDKEGASAIQKISKLLSSWEIQVFSVRFDDTFPHRFDLADEFPPNHYRDGRYKGPSFVDMLHPATWATAVVEEQPTGQRGRPRKPSYHLRQCFVDQWSAVKLPTGTLFVNRELKPDFIRNDQGFNDLISPFSHGPVAPLLVKQESATVEKIAYDPGKPARIITDYKGHRAVNTFRPSRITAFVRPADMSDAEFVELVKPWTDFLCRLFPVESDRENAMKFCATLMARPDIRMKFAMLLVSRTQGTGKTTLTNILQHNVGEHNTSPNVSQADIESEFNDWLAHKRLVIVPEIYAGHSWRMYQKLKSLITDESVLGNTKYLAKYEVQLWVVFVFCSNAAVALAIEDTDRRVFVPQVTEDKQEKPYWVALYSWLESGGYSIISCWATEYVAKFGAFTAADHAPDSWRKSKMIEDSRLPVHDYIRGLGTVMMEQPISPLPIKREADGRIVAHEGAVARGAKALVVLDISVREWIAEKLKRDDRLPSLATIRRELETVGVCVSEKKVRWKGEVGFPCANFQLPDDVVGSQLPISLPQEILPM